MRFEGEASEQKLAKMGGGQAKKEGKVGSDDKN